MDTIDLDLTRREAGANFLTSVEALNLRPDALFWSFDKIENRFVLVLVTELFDFKGPLPIAEVLLKAYNASATPREIDPFIVRLHSPRHALIKQFKQYDRDEIEILDKHQHRFKNEDGSERDPVYLTGITLGDVEFRHAWVYRFDLPPKRNTVDLVRRWKRVEREVEKLAA